MITCGQKRNRYPAGACLFAERRGDWCGTTALSGVIGSYRLAQKPEVYALRARQKSLAGNLLTNISNG